MLLSRLVSRSISSFVILFVALLLIGNPISTAAQLPPFVPGVQRDGLLLSPQKECFGLL